MKKKWLGALFSVLVMGSMAACSSGGSNTSKGEIDENRLMLSFVKDIRENKCGLITWEKPHVG